MFSPIVWPLAVSASEVQVLRDLLHHRRQAAGVAEVLHQVLARRLQVDQARQLAGRAGPSRRASSFDADAAGDRDAGGSPRWSSRRSRRWRVIAFSNACAREDLRQRQVLVHHLDDAPARPCARCTLRRPSTAGIGGVARQADAERLDHAGHRATRCPSSCSGRGERCMQLSASRNSCSVIVPARTCSRMLHTPVPEPSSWPRHLPLSIGPPETPIVGRSTLAAPISSDGRGLVAAHQQHDAVDRIAADRFLDVHAGEVADTASRWAAAASRRATSPGTRAGSRRLRRRRASRARRASRKCELQGVSSLTRCCRCR